MSKSPASTPSADDSASGTGVDQRPSVAGHMAARIDRLPLTRVQWGLALLVESAWGIIVIDTDGIGARLYPFIWRPQHLISPFEYGVIQALQVGLGILLGVYLVGWIADRFGRRLAICLSALLAGMFFWPFALVTNFWGLCALSALSTLGVGGILVTHSTYISEIVAPQYRNQVLLGTQSVTAAISVFIALLGYFTFPDQWKLYMWVGTVLQLGILLPLLLWLLPESPRWAEAHGRPEEAERLMADLEERCRRASGAPLPEPHPRPNPVILAGPNAWRELFANPLYRNRVVPLMICWILGYGGIIYGSGAFAGVYMVDHGGSAQFVFGVFTIAAVATFVAFLANAWLRERFERRDVILAVAILFSVAWVFAYLFPSKPSIAIFYTIGRVSLSLWLFNMYNYTAVAFPTRIRAVAFAWTDGLGHLGAWASVTLLGLLYGMGPNHLGWVLFIIIPGALLPGLLIRVKGIKQAGAVLEHVSR